MLTLKKATQILLAHKPVEEWLTSDTKLAQQVLMKKATWTEVCEVVIPALGAIMEMQD